LIHHSALPPFSVSVSQDRVSVQNEKIDQYLSQIQSLEENKNTQQHDFLKELTAQKKLVDLYKMNLDDSLKHIERLEDNLSSLTSHCTEQTNSFKNKIIEMNSNFTEKMRQVDHDHTVQLNELQKQLKELHQQKENYEMNDSSSSAGGGGGVGTGGGSGSTLQIVSGVCGASRTYEENYLPTEYELIGQGHTLTTIYSHGILIEKELNDVKLKKQELELYLDRILRDIENKAPMIASLRRDHMRLIESHDQLTKRLDNIINENHKYKKINFKLEKDLLESVNETSSLHQMNSDLCKQIQHLLKFQNHGVSHLSDEQQSSYQQQLSLFTRTSSTVDAPAAAAHDVITEYLVTYETIEELQKRNIQLLSIVRRLSTEQEEKVSYGMRGRGGGGGGGGSGGGDNEGSQLVVSMNQEEIQVTLSQTLSELESMRESRQRMEDMVSSLIQQRDIYRAMLEDVDGTQQHPRTPGHTSAPSTPTSTSRHLSSTTHKQQQHQHQQQLEDLQLKLKETEDILHKVQDRTIRLEHIEETLNNSLEKLQDENSSLRSQLIQTSSSSQYHQNRVESLEVTMKSLQNSYEILSSKKSEMDGMLISHQRVLQEQEMKYSELNDQFRQQTEISRRVCLERDVLKEQEKRFIEQIFEQKEELKKQSQLTESMYRIETNLTSNLTTQNKKLEEEVDLLRGQLKSIEKSELEYKLITEQKLANTSDELKLYMLKIQQKQTENSELKEELLRERSQVTMAHERSVILEKQLHLLQERFQHSTSTVITNDVIINENQEKELVIQKQLLEIQKLENEVRISRENSEQFQHINLHTEKIFKEYQQKSQKVKEQLEQQHGELMCEITELKKELNEKKSQLIEVRNENETLHETLQNKTKESQQEMSRTEMELNKSRELEEMTRGQLEGMRVELLTLQVMLNESNDNYERELMQHSQTIQKYKEMEKTSMTLQKEGGEMVNKLHDITMKCMEYEKLLENQKSHSEGIIAGLNEQLSNLKHTNDLLHNQVQIMSYEINKQTFQTIQRISSEEEEGRGDVQEQSEELKESGEMILTHATGTIDQHQTHTQQQQQQQQQQIVTELREVIKYMKREKDMLEAKYTVCEMEKTRYSNETMSLNKALDEMKLELHRELCLKGQNSSSNTSSLRSESEIQTLLHEVNQLNILRESNIHLRNENQEKSQLIITLNEKITQLQHNHLFPLTEKIILLESNLNILKTEKESLLIDCNYWKDRLHQLISRYNDVDPEEHRLLKEKLISTEEISQNYFLEIENQKKKVDNIEKKFLETETQLKNVLQELNSAKVTAETMEKTSESLRGRLREFNKQIQTQKTIVSQLTASCESHQQKIQEQQNTIQKLQNEVVAANSATQDATAQATTAASALVNAQSLLSKQPKQVETVPPSTSTELDVTTSSSTLADITVTVVPSQQTASTADKKSDLQSLREAAMRRMSAAKKKHVEGEGDVPVQKKPRQTPGAVATSSPSTLTTAPAAAAPTPTPAPAAPIVAPVVAAVATPQATPVKCYYFSTPSGCRNGDNCRFQHVIEETPPQPSVETIEEVSGQSPDPTPAIASPEPEAAEEESQQVASKDMEIANEEEAMERCEDSPPEQGESLEAPEENSMTEVATEVPPPVPILTSAPSTATSAPKPFGSNATFQLFTSFGKPATATAPPTTFGALTRPAQTAPMTSSTTPAAPQTTGTVAQETPVAPAQSSPFLNLRPPSPSSTKVTLQFGSGAAKLSVPANLPPASVNQTLPVTPSTGFKGFGSSLFRPASASTATPTPTAAPAKFGGFLQSNTPVKAFAIPTTTTSAVAPAVESVKETSVEKVTEESNPAGGMEEENEGEFEEGEEDNEGVGETAEQSNEATEQASQVSLATKVLFVHHFYPID
jgi:nucleoprotein TPR